MLVTCIANRALYFALPLLESCFPDTETAVDAPAGARTAVVIATEISSVPVASGT
jgi:hypothetical protein